MRLLASVLNDEYVPRRLNLKPSSAEQMRYSLRSFEKFIGKPPMIADLTETTVLRWLHARLQECKPTTVKRERGDILTLWRFCHKIGHHPLPAPEIDPIKVPKRIPRAFSVNDLERVLAVTRRLRGTMRGFPLERRHWYTSLVLFAYDTGARLSAILGVPPRDVNMGERYALLEVEHSKTGIEQMCNLSDQTVAAIAPIYDPHRELVWPYPWHKRRLWLDLKEICDAAGVLLLKGEGFHILRKTHATYSVKTHGWQRAQADLGHTAEQMTRRYVDPRLLGNRGLDLPRPECG
jgi:integrase